MHIGTRDAFIKLHDRHYQTMWFLAKKGISVGLDQHFMRYNCYCFKEACYLHFSERLKEWFDLSHVLSKQFYIKSPTNKI